MFHQTATINLDISDFSLKATKLSRQRDGVYIDALERAQLPVGYIENGRILKAQEVAERIHKILTSIQNGHARQRLVNTVLPDTTTFVKLIAIPQNDPTKPLTREEVYKEASHHIPYELEDIYLSWQELGSDKSRLTHVLVGACPKAVVNEYITVLHASGFIPKSLEIESLPITRSIFHLQKKQASNLSNRNIVIIDLGEARSSLIFYREQKFSGLDTIEFSVSVPLSGTRINQLIEKKLSLTTEQTEKFKRECGLETEGKCKGVLLKLLKPTLRELVHKLHQAIDLHNTHFKGAQIEKIILSGGGANLAKLDMFLSKETGIEVVFADPLTNIVNKKALDKKEALSYCTVLGLGLRELF